MFEDHHLSVSNLRQVDTVTAAHFLWSWSRLGKPEIINIFDVRTYFTVVSNTRCEWTKHDDTHHPG